MQNLQTIVEVYKNSTRQVVRDDVEVNVCRIMGTTTLTYENKDEVENILEFCEDHDVPLILRLIKPVAWASERPNEWQKLGNPSGEHTPGEELVKLAREKNQNTGFVSSSNIGGYCTLLSFGLTVKNDGSVQLCPDHDASKGRFGNVKTSSLTAIMKKLHQSRKLKPGFCINLPKLKYGDH